MTTRYQIKSNKPSLDAHGASVPGESSSIIVSQEREIAFIDPEVEDLSPLPYGCEF